MTWPMYRHRECRFEGRIVRLTPLETEILATLLLRRGCPVKPWEMIEAVYEVEAEPDAPSTMRVHIHNLRRKLPGLIRQHGPEQRRGFQGWVVDRPRSARLAA